MTDIELALVEYDGNGKYPYCDLVYKGLKLLQNQSLILSQYEKETPPKTCIQVGESWQWN